MTDFLQQVAEFPFVIPLGAAYGFLYPSANFKPFFFTEVLNLKPLILHSLLVAAYLNITVIHFILLCVKNRSVYIERNGNSITVGNGAAWVINTPIEESIKNKIQAIGIPLSEWDININFGIKTGFNGAFIIPTAVKDELIRADSKSAEIIRPILRGRDIQRYAYNFADLWLISTFPSRQYNIDDFPAIKKHLLSFGIERLEQTGEQHRVGGKTIKARKKTNNKWFETQDSISYWNDFFKQKIVWKRIGSKLRFSYDDTGIFCLDSTCFATGEGIPFLVAVLNTTMGNYLLRDSPKTGTGDLIISVQALEPIRIPVLSAEEQQPYKRLLKSILENIKEGRDYSNIEEELDAMVFDAYGLTAKERSFVKQTVVLSSFCWYAFSGDMKCCRNVTVYIGVRMISGGKQLILERTQTVQSFYR